MANSNSESINDNDISKSKNHAPSSQNSSFAIMDMLARGQLISQAIYIAAKFRIADYLKNGPKSVEELAEQSNTHPDLVKKVKSQLGLL